MLEPERRVERFSECAVEGVEVDQSVRGDSVEGHRASRPVQIHCHLVRNRARITYAYICMDFVVSEGREAASRAAQAPRLVTETEAAVGTCSFSSDASVSHSDGHPPFPLHLPVTAASQSIGAQQLLPVVEPLWVIRIRLLLPHQCHRPVVLGQREECVCRVWVQGDCTCV